MKVVPFLLLVLVSFASRGQKKNHQIPPPSPPGETRKVIYRKHNRIPYSELKKRFPFNETETVLLISFTATGGIDPGIITSADSPSLRQLKAPARLPGTADTFGHIEVREMIKIGDSLIRHIADMFYNLDCGEGPMIGYGCYSPRNAIIFLDKYNRQVAELEICFECQGYEMRPKEFAVGDMRECKYIELKKFFAKAGVHYGIDNANNSSHN